MDEQNNSERWELAAHEDNPDPDHTTQLTQKNYNNFLKPFIAFFKTRIKELYR